MVVTAARKQRMKEVSSSRLAGNSGNLFRSVIILDLRYVTLGAFHKHIVQIRRKTTASALEGSGSRRNLHEAPDLTAVLAGRASSMYEADAH